MKPEPIVHQGEVEVTGRLTNLGLQASILRAAAAEGDRARAECTLNDPPILPGFLAWARTVRALRERLLPQGWHRDDSRNYSTVLSPDRDLAIAVAAGDDKTGTEQVPSTKSSKGPATEKAVSQNQLSFFDAGETYPQPRKLPGIQTWLLLHFIDSSSGEIRLELSLPADMDEDGHVAAWLERIVLAPLPLTRELQVGDNEGAEEEIDIEIERRST